MNFIKNQKLVFIGAAIGAIVGFLYWKEIGCLSGTCTIQSVWYKMTLYGTVMGALLASIAKDYVKKKKPN